MIHFLRSPKVTHNEDVERRLQQKSVIALSRLCSDVEASKQVVENGGLNKLIQLCRERNERFSSDAVLVAALVSFIVKTMLKVVLILLYFIFHRLL